MKTLRTMFVLFLLSSSSLLAQDTSVIEDLQARVAALEKIVSQVCVKRDKPLTSKIPCGKLTKAGKPCTRKAIVGGMYCWQHQGK